MEGFKNMPKMRRTRKRRNKLQKVWNTLGGKMKLILIALLSFLIISIFLTTWKLIYRVNRMANYLNRKKNND